MQKVCHALAFGHGHWRIWHVFVEGAAAALGSAVPSAEPVLVDGLGVTRTAIQGAYKDYTDRAHAAC